MNFIKNINKMYLIIFFHNLIPAYVIERLFWEERGMTVLMVVLTEIIYALTIVALEIPTGIIADKFGRKKSLIVWAGLSALEMILLLYANSFMDFAFMVFLAGISTAMGSGAFNALIYDSLLYHKKENKFEKILGRANAFDLIGAVIAALSGSLLAKLYGFEFNYILSAISMIISFIVVITLKEPPRFSEEEKDEDAEEKKLSFREYVVNAILFYKNSPRIGYIIVSAMTLGACVNYVDEFWQLYVREINIPIVFFGVFSATSSLIRIPGNLIADYVKRFAKVEKIIDVVFIITSIGLILTSYYKSMIGIVIIMLIYFLNGVVEPLVSGVIHHETESYLRATVDSFQSLVERILIFVLGLGFGYIASNRSVTIGFMFLGIFLIIIRLVMRLRVRNEIDILEKEKA